MSLKIIFSEYNLFYDFKDELKESIQFAYHNHPLFNDKITKPINLQINVFSTEKTRTEINYDNYNTEKHINLYLDEYHFIDGDTGKFNQRVINYIFHELSHFIDAKINRSFCYDDSIKEQLTDSEKRIHDHLWNAFIDARLGDKAPSTLSSRMNEALNCDNIPCKYINNAWKNGFKTYLELINTAKVINM